MSGLESLSDEDFLNQYAAGSEDSSQTPEPEKQAEEPVVETAQEETPVEATSEAPAPDESLFDQSEDTTLETALDQGNAPASEPTAEEVPQKDAAAPSGTPDHTTPHPAKPSEQKPEEAEKPDEKDGEKKGADAPVAEKPADGETPPTDYEAGYKALMAPFKANGSEFQVRSPEEARRLMQMGANYGKKMQELAPNLKQMRALNNHGLLNDEKLNFLIDLSKHDKNAIQKLLHESGIDPLDLDVQTKPAYQPGNHQITDEEQAFYNTVEEVSASEEGNAILTDVNKVWDQQSKQILFQAPNLLTILTAQKESGIYDRITAEINRQKTLGMLGPQVPFLDAYKHVGDTLHAAGQLTPQTAQAPAPSPLAQPSTTGDAEQPVADPSSTSPAPQPLETRPATARSTVHPNGEKAKAASAARSVPPQPPKPFDPFTMTDEEILRMGNPSS
jgi:hypothetical protein